VPDPLFEQLIVGLVPLPHQVPPAPFPPEDLQRLFAELSKDANYQQFQFLPGGAGAQLFSAADDMLMVQPGLIQLRRRIETTPERTRETVIQILRIAEKRLQLDEYVQCGIKVIAHAQPPAMTDAKVFVADRLMREGHAITQELGPTFFGGGVQFISVEPQLQEILILQPLIVDNSLLYLDYDTQRAFQFKGIESVSGWIDEAFDFIRGPAMRILEV